MERTFIPGLSERGWEVYDGFAFPPESESEVFATESECQRECDRWNAESRAWNLRGMSDAPHMDAH